MKTFLLGSVSFLLIVSAVHGQTNPYASRGVKSFLVNYHAINSDKFLAEFAAKRFSLIDEASGNDIALIRAVNPDMPILRYQDIVALHESYPEYEAVNRDEWAFVHSCEPSGLNVFSVDSTYHVEWIPDRREDIVGYHLYWLADSLGVPTKINTNHYIEPYADVQIPDHANYLLVASINGTWREIQYGLPVHIKTALSKGGMLIPDYIGETRTADTVFLNYVLRETILGHPDSVYIIGDWDRNNALHESTEKYRMNWLAGKWRFSHAIATHGARTNAGYEFAVEVRHKGQRTTIPLDGKWHTNVNNRTKNDTYGFYVMNVGSSTWRKAYIDQVLNAFQSNGYTGLFEDDCWYRIANYGVDSYPPVPYDDKVWLQDLYTMLDSIKVAISPRPAYFNGLGSVTSDTLLLHTDGGMTEGFACTHWSGIVAGNTWRNQCNRGLSALHRFNSTWMALAGSSSNLIDERMYVLGSYLLLADTKSMFGNAVNYQQFAHYPEFDIPLGAPLSSAGTDIEDLAVEIDGERIYIREFEHGTVVVNPSSSPVIYTPGAGLPSLEPVGGITTEGGRLETKYLVHLLHPATAMIFLKGGPGDILESPVIDSIVVSPATVLADGKTVCTVSVLVHDSSAARFRSNPAFPLRVYLESGSLVGLSAIEMQPDAVNLPAVPTWYRGTFTVPVGALPDTSYAPFTVEASAGLITVGNALIQIESAEPENYLLNYSFEIDADNNGAPDVWQSYMQGFDYDISGQNAVTGTRSIHVKNDSLTNSRGIRVSVLLNQRKPEQLYLSGWSKAVNVSGSKNSDYALYADIRYFDGTSLYGRIAAFNTGTHDWEFSGAVITPQQPIHTVSLYALFRNHTGEVWFDHIGLKPYTPTSVYDLPIPSQAQIDVYPNPLSGNEVTVVVSPQDEQITHIAFYDAVGRMVSEKYYENSPEQNTRITYPMTNRNPGVYYVRVTTRSGTKVKPVLVLR